LSFLLHNVLPPQSLGLFTDGAFCHKSQVDMIAVDPGRERFDSELQLRLLREREREREVYRSVCSMCERSVLFYCVGVFVICYECDVVGKECVRVFYQPSLLVFLIFIFLINLLGLRPHHSLKKISFFLSSYGTLLPYKILLVLYTHFRGSRYYLNIQILFIYLTSFGAIQIENNIIG